MAVNRGAYCHIPTLPSVRRRPACSANPSGIGIDTSSLALLADGLTQIWMYWDNLGLHIKWIIVPLPAMDHYTTHTQRRSTDEIPDSTIRETVTARDKAEYDSDKASTDLEDFPDGGFRAWLIIGGVRYKITLTRFDHDHLSFSRLCAAPSQRERQPHTLSWLR